jgi:hypothetical protein
MEAALTLARSTVSNKATRVRSDHDHVRQTRAAGRSLLENSLLQNSNEAWSFLFRWSRYRFARLSARRSNGGKIFAFARSMQRR